VGSATASAPRLDSRFDELRAGATVEWLSSAELAGRRVVSIGHERAADGLADELDALGFAVTRRAFTVAAQLLDLDGPAAAGLEDGRALVHRRDFAEHPRSQAFASAEGVVGDTWAVLETVPPAEQLDKLARELRAAGAVGILAPQRPFDGYLAKRIVAAPELLLPILAVRDDLLAELRGRTLTASLPLRRLPVSGAHLTAARPGADPRLEREPLLLTAHYDGLGDDPEQRLPGAADNASGVAVVLEVARALGGAARERGLIVALLDAEEVDALGSRALAAELAGEGVRPLVLNVDLAAQFTGRVVVEASDNARPLLEALDAAGRDRAVPLELGSVSSDNRRFAAAGFPSVGVGLGAASYHTPADTASRVEPFALAVAGSLVLGAAERIL
jgi:aminopeptidase YwaD